MLREISADYVMAADLIPVLEAAARARINVGKRVAPVERRITADVRRLYVQAGSAYIRRIRFRETGTVHEAVSISNISSSVGAALSGVRNDLLKSFRKHFTDLFKLGWLAAPVAAGAGSVPDVREEANTFAQAMYTGFAAHFGDAMTNVSQDLSRKGMTPKEITDKLTSEIKTRSLSSAKAVASDTAMIAFNNGYRDVARATGAKRKQWITAGDNRVDEQCVANASAGEIPLGKDFPSGVAYAPAHTSCRCVVDYSWS